MAEQFPAWRAALREGEKGPVDPPPATRGLPWEHRVELEGDWTGATLLGRIRIAPDAASALATMATAGPVVAGGVSTFTLSLTGAETLALPADSEADGVVRFPYALLLAESGGEFDTLYGGTFTLLGLV